jgi:hypothetical protein
MNAAHGSHLAGDVDGVVEGENDDFGGSGGDGLEDRGDVDGAGGDAEFGAAAEGAGEELGLHAVGIGNEDGDGGGWRRDGQNGSEGNGIEERPDLRGGGSGTQGQMSHYSGRAFKSGTGIIRLWKKCDEPEWDWRRSGRSGEECGRRAALLLGAGVRFLLRV